MLISNTVDEETYGSLKAKSVTLTRNNNDYCFQERIRVPHKGLTGWDVIFIKGILTGTNACNVIGGHPLQAVDSETCYMEGKVYMGGQQFPSLFKQCRHIKNCEQRSHLPIVEHTKVNVWN